MTFREWWQKFSQQDASAMRRLVLIGAMGLALLAIGSFGMARPSPPKPQTRMTVATALQAQESEVGQQLAALLDAVPGVRQVTVAVTLSRSIQSQYATGSDTAGGTGSSLVLVSTANGQSAVPLDQIGPMVAGVVVVTPSAVHPWIRSELAQAVQTLLQIQPYQVLVLPNQMP
jgi:stage III sporulation protein AG